MWYDLRVRMIAIFVKFRVMIFVECINRIVLQVDLFAVWYVIVSYLKVSRGLHSFEEPFQLLEVRLSDFLRLLTLHEVDEVL